MEQDELEALLNSYSEEAEAENRRLLLKHAGKNKPRGGPALREAGLRSRIAADNVGHALLKKMGWSEGTAIGRDRSGRSEPLELNIKAGRAGLGVDEQRRRAREQQQLQVSKGGRGVGGRPEGERCLRLECGGRPTLCRRGAVGALAL